MISNNVILALGADVKNQMLIADNNRIYQSTHIGDLQDVQNFNRFKKEINKLVQTMGKKLSCVAYDLHPGFFSSRFARENSLFKAPCTHVVVQHHHAHIASVLYENPELEKVIGVSFDGTGYGSDGALWGGEFLLVEKGMCKRLAHCMYQKMPGGEKVVLEPWRMAVSIVGEHSLPFLKKVPHNDKNLVAAMIQKNINTPLTSSAGRLFDAAAALLGIAPYASYEAEGPIKLESLCAKNIQQGYPFSVLKNDHCYIIDTRPVFLGMLKDITKRKHVAIIAAQFHNTMIEIIVSVVKRLSKELNIKDIVLSGGVFQNKYLFERTCAFLKQKGFNVYSNKTISVNDANIAWGQYYVSRAAGKN